MGGFVSISVYEETRVRLREFQIEDESYDSAINRLLDCYCKEREPQSHCLVAETEEEITYSHIEEVIN
jgi:hypothetical protein